MEERWLLSYQQLRSREEQDLQRVRGAIGAAVVFAANLKFSEHRPRCEEELTRLFMDGDEEVRRSAAFCFREIENGTIGEYEGLAQALAESPALLSEGEHLLFALEEADEPIPELLHHVCHTWIQRARAHEQEAEARWLGQMHVAKLVNRAYSQAMQTTNRTLQLECLDLIDTMLAAGVGVSADFLRAFDR